MLVVEWCNLCNARPSDGVLTILDPETNKPLDVQSCVFCVAAIPKEDWMLNDWKD
jgi:hypothetical protein